MDTAIVLFNRDLRLHDHPALAEACARARHVVPLFVLDPAVPAGLRMPFLLDCLRDLREALRARGGDLVVRRGDAVAETVRLARETGARAVHATADVSALARDRERRLADGPFAFRTFPGVTVVPPGELLPAGGGDHYRVFTPYWRAWCAARRRTAAQAPASVTLPPGLDPGDIPDGSPHDGPPHGARGGEGQARARLERWVRDGLAGYAGRRDDMAADRTSRLSPYIRFGCLSPLELAGLPGEEFVRQLCWRDFHHQVTLAFPELNRRDYRPRGRHWHDDADAVAAWKEGATGVPIVDAGMRQLRAEGWMHNRARLITAGYLVRELGVDWRTGAAHFFELLLDGEVADNSGNWQWVAGTGNDTRPNRGFNAIRQATRFDPDGGYVRRYVPELADVPVRFVHEPWRSPVPIRGYPQPQHLRAA
ncbi:cryptochrome/photolyase family protein [Nonomuraea roseoviolacea]|uniref:Deoxyribodipyrimidine photo-lyase n=1 Tax=Nonomuraea roseoviolacea subsp. carminata TaxID=160689 RepID=A0ABT1K690_9ACTN|nr:deoxyribodipyrimidine photo-lyase [Nonomuraea roseoviolacea]MCP2349514.1 deoxyribodipyrimidine photo-lyase [Nonomuraea roseoviolacea subsp. carminata]